MYYPDQPRYAKLAAESMGAEFADLDGGNGYIFRVTKNGRSLLSGAGGVCSYVINSASSVHISRDKAHTKTILRLAGIPVIEGRHFFVNTSHRGLRNDGHELEDALPYAQSLGFPVFCKPLAGARGDFAEIVTDAESLRDYAGRVDRRHDAFLMERLTKGDEYRVLIHDGRPVFCSVKAGPEITGDGVRTLAELLEELNTKIAGTGISAWHVSMLAASGLDAGYIPRAGETVALAGRQNLSTYGGVERVEIDVPAPLAEMSIAACRALNLRLGGVDLFDTSPARDLSGLVVIEVNGNPGLKTLEQAGRLDLILDIWRSMIREFTEEPHVRPA